MLLLVRSLLLLQADDPLVCLFVCVAVRTFVMRWWGMEVKLDRWGKGVEYCSPKLLVSDGTGSYCERSSAADNLVCMYLHSNWI